jgi:hypothetical protein
MLSLRIRTEEDVYITTHRGLSHFNLINVCAFPCCSPHARGSLVVARIPPCLVGVGDFPIQIK